MISKKNALFHLLFNLNNMKTKLTTLPHKKTKLETNV